MTIEENGIEVTNDVVEDVEVNDADIDIINDPILRKLPVGSEAFQAELDSRNGNTDETETEKSEEDEVPADDIEEEASDDDEVVQSKPKKGFAKRIGQLTAKTKALEAKLAEYENQSQQPEPEVEYEPARVESEDKPTRSQYRSDEDFIDALTDWKIEQREVQKEYESTRTQVVSTWNERQAAFEEEAPDFTEVVTAEAIMELELSEEESEFLTYADNGPEILYKLFSDDDRLDEYLDANLFKRAAILSSLAEQHSQPEVRQTANVSKAPKPPRSMPKGKASGSPAKSIYDENLSMAEFRRLREKK